MNLFGNLFPFVISRLVAGASSPLIDGHYTINFKQCLSIATENPTDKQPHSPEGHRQAQTSAVLYDLCDQKHEHCKEHVIDMNLFLASVMEQPVAERARYCHACQHAVASCFFDSDEKNLRQRRKRDLLYTNTKGPVEYVECEHCEELNCFDKVQAEEEAMILNWMDGLLGCPRVSVGGWQGHDLYAGFMCNEVGPQIALFLDPLCTLYTSEVSFENFLNNTTIYTNPEIALHRRTNEIVAHPFLHPIECAEVNYLTPGQQDSIHIHHKEDEIWALNNYCTSAITESADLDNCPDQSIEGEQDFLLSIEQAGELQDICSVARNYEENQDSPLWNVYRPGDNVFGTGSGSLFSYEGSTLGQPTNAENDAFRFPTIELLIVTALVVFAAALAYRRYTRERETASDSQQQSPAQDDLKP